MELALRSLIARGCWPGQWPPCLRRMRIVRYFGTRHWPNRPFELSRLESRASGVPIRRLFVGVGESQHRQFRKRRGANLEADRQARASESARDRDRGESVDVK